MPRTLRLQEARIDAGITECEACGDYEFERTEFANRYHGDWVCENCYNSLCEENNDYDGDDYSSSDDDCSGINGYSYKPSPKFYTMADGSINVSRNHIEPSVPVFGIELEVENVNGGYLSEAVDFINNNTAPLVYLKEDCSINHGFEIVSHPMSLDYFKHVTIYKEMLDYLRNNGYNAWKTSTCGLHIHVSKVSFIDPKHQMKFLYFIFKNKNELIKFSGRNSSYAKYDFDAFVNNQDSAWGKNKPNIIEVVKGVQKNGNYAPGAWERNLAVNRMGSFTHELRIFRPSLRFNTVMAYMEFVECLFMYTKQITSNEILKHNGLKFDALVRFAMTQNDRYSTFVNRVIKRNVLEQKEGN